MTRSDVRIPNGYTGDHDVFTEAAARSLIGQTPRFTRKFGDQKELLGNATIVDAHLDDDGSIIATIDYPDHEGTREALAFGQLGDPNGLPAFSIGYLVQEPRRVLEIGPNPGQPATPEKD